MTTGLREVGPDDLQAALEQFLAPRLASLLAARRAGHCARIVDVETSLAVRLCERVRRSVHNNAQVLVLGTPPQVPSAIAVTSTKLVELRNPDDEGRLRAPLLVFVPPGTHASAEDSFGVATFEEIPLGDVYDDLADQLLAGLPTDVRRAATEILATAEEGKWPYATSYARVRFLLTIGINDNDPEVVGAAFFELGLVPDLELLADPAMVRTRTGLNIKQVEILIQPDRPDRQRVLDLGLTDRAFRAKFSAFAAAAGLDDPREWTRRIVIDRANWQFSFHRWPLRDARNVEAARIIVADLPLPQAGDDPQHANNPLLRNLAGQPFFVAGQQGPNQLPVTFEARPDPRRIPGLARFTAQIISEDSGPTGVVASVRPSAVGRSGHKATFRNLRRANLEPGWHFVRVLPVDDEGIPLPVEPSGSSSHPDNESERFFIVVPAADDADDLPSPERPTIHLGVMQALRAAQFQAQQDGRDWRTVQSHSVGWHGTGHHALRASFGPHGVADIPLSPALTDIQRRTLADPGRPVRWQLRVDSDETTGTVQHDEIGWPTAAAGPVDAFLEARAAALGAIHADSLVVEGTDLQALRPAAQTYAEAYGELLAWQLQQAERSDETQRTRVLADLTAMLQVDTVEAAVIASDGTRRTVTLVGPTHPLRMLWLITWAELGRHWLDGSADTSRSAMSAAGRTLAALAPLGFPFVVLLAGGRLTMAAADLTPYWGACLPTDTPDPQALLARLARALRVPTRQPGGDRVISPRVLADRVERYVRQHPYVTTLVISAVNVGRADLLADTLVEVQRRRHLKHMRYDIRVFTPDVAIAGSGEALASLLRDEWTTAADAEAFHTRQASGLIPKLSVAVLPLADFRAVTDARQSHLTFLFDAFSGETFDAAPAIVSPGILPVHGLVQDVTVTYEEDDGGAVWRKQPRHGRAAWIPGAEEACDLLTSLPATISSAAAAVATGQVGAGLVPRITLSLTPADSALLHQAHRSSDWVITIDRTLGMEYFDTPGSTRRPDYVIDFDGSSDGSLDHHLVISSRSIDELRAMLAPAISQHGLSMDPRHTGTFFEQLRLLSGRLAFKLASTAPTQRTEVLGLALARLYLDYQGVLTDQVLVPLDDHLELYREARRTASQDIGDAVSLQRTDLALWSLDARRRSITCRLVEVKCYSSLPGAVGYEQLKERIAGQLRSSEDILAARFDPAHDLTDRPDRTVRNAELGQLLRFYLGRAIRHGTMRQDAAGEAEWLLGNLDRGKYQMRFTRTGLIFDLAGEGTSSEADDGVEYHRIGRDLIEELLEAIPTDPLLAAGAPAMSTSPTMSTLDASLPRLAQAAFRAPDRDHETPDEPRPALADLADDLDAENTGVALEIPEAVADGEDQTKGTIGAIGPPDIVTPSVFVEFSAKDSARGLITPTASRTHGEVPDIFLGTSQPSPQYGILGQDAHFGRTVALDLNETHTISLFGVQGGGKSYTLGSIIEAATLPAPPVSQLPQPLATIVFHYSPTLDYEPEFTTMNAPNSDRAQLEELASRYGGTPGALQDIVLLVPADQLELRRAEHPELKVLPLKFSSQELRAEHWRFLMGAVGNQSTYIRQLQRIMKARRSHLRLDAIREGIMESGLTDALKQLAEQRLDLAEEYIDDSASIKEVVRPGRMIIVDLRDEFIERDEALGLFLVLMQLFADAQRERFNKLVVFDEAHKYIDSPDLVDGLVSSVREMRHKGMSVLVASQDPPSVPIKLIELSDVVILHKFNSPAWLRHMQKATVSLAELTPARMSNLTPGEAYVWSSKATDQDFTRGAVRMRLRPRMTRHGGGTRTAVD